MRLTPPAVAAVAALALAVFTAGCGSSTAVTVDPVAQAAEATTRAGGAHMSFAGQISASALPSPVMLSGEGFFNYKAQEGTLTLDLTGLPASPVLPAGPLHMEEILKAGSVYLGSPLFAGRLPGGARWMKLDLARSAAALGFNLQQLTGGQSNPAQFLEYLKAAGGSVTPEGRELVRGVPTTRYSGSIDLRKVADFLPARERSLLRNAISQLSAESGVSRLPFNVWIDDHKLVRRMTIALSFSASGQTGSVNLTVDLFGFGATPTVAAPPSGEVFDATSDALGALSSHGG